MKITNTFIVIIATAILILNVSKDANTMNMFKNDFERKWEELSADVEKLNEYTSLRPVELRNVNISEHNLDGAIFTGAKFSGISWEFSSIQKSVFTKVVFERCKFTQSNLSYSTFTEVTFKDCEFIDSDIDRSKLVDVRFESCKFTQMGLVGNEGNTLRLAHCHMLDSGMGDCTIDFEIKDCTLDGVDVSTSKGGRKVLIEGGLLSEVDFGDSHFSTITLRRVRQGEGGVKFNDMTAETITFDNVDMTRGTAIARSQVKNVVIIGGNFGTAFDGSSIDHIYLRDANLFFMEFSEVKLPKVSITNCRLYDTGLYDGYIDEFVVYNSEFEIIAGKNFKADIVLWDNVTLNGNIDLTNAQVNDFRPTRLKRGPQLKMITTGSNMRF